MHTDNITPPAGNTSLPYAIVHQWQAAIRLNTPCEWAYTAGMIGGSIGYDRSIMDDLMFLHSIAHLHSRMAGVKTRKKAKARRVSA